MDFLPTKEAFISCYEQGKAQLLWTEIPTDLQTPVSAMLKVKAESPYHVLLESVEGGEKKSRYSIIAFDPDILWKCDDDVASINRIDVLNEGDFVSCDAAPFDALRALIDECKMEIPQGLPPMSAGIFGYMGYDMVRLMERLPDNNPDPINVAQSIYMRPRSILIFDSVKDVAMVIAPVYVDDAVNAAVSYQQAKQRVVHVVDLLNGSIPQENSYSTDAYAGATHFDEHVSEADYIEVVEKSKEYIRAGDIFQIVPSRRLSMDFPYSPFALYRALRHLNPSPYLFYAHMGDFALVGSSPEILVKCEDNEVTIRPLAGTRGRGKTPELDVLLEKELLADEKELAEHLMLLDLGRNDVGRVSTGGTVKVTDKMVVERYSHVMHISSNVTGQLAAGKDEIDALIAGFPAGTLTGAPKIRAMEIIDELEKEKRSFYGGTVGYFSANGTMDTCIMLRTALVKQGKIYAQAGAGVVADSVAESEFEETVNKAGAIVEAAHQAVRYL